LKVQSEAHKTTLTSYKLKGLCKLSSIHQNYPSEDPL
jgi:hypothetical protein